MSSSAQVANVQVSLGPKPEATTPDAAPLFKRLLYYINPVDGRYEDLRKGNRALNVFRDFTAGLIVAMVAIPLAMGFAMASGLRPEQGIVGGAIAGLIGALWGGSKYQVYGPTAAFIPVIGGLMAKYDHGVLVLASVLAGLILMGFGVARLGRIVAKVPHSIVVGFTIGIAITIALSQIGEVLGLKAKMGYGFFEKLGVIAANFGAINYFAVILGLGTFLLTKYILKVSVFIPAPLLAIGVTTVVAATMWSDKGFTLVRDRYGYIPTDFWVFTKPAAITWNAQFLGDLTYFVIAIVFVAAVESLLCSRMADRLADNRGMPYNPNKELWGQGLVQVVIPLLNGFPHTGALARTATNIKLGAISPLAGVFKCFLKLGLALYLASYLELVPMACIGGILLYVATAMVKPAEVKQVLAHNRFHIGLMVYTAVMVVVTDFLTGVLSAVILWGLLHRLLDKPVPAAEQALAQS
ncbi:MAG TPA: SulP family inorganic anion transporter [Bryobacteraceae bacterium]|nr:SulP family inorganic anion transporter [Bryobacteraceae bacterium]